MILYAGGRAGFYGGVGVCWVPAGPLDALPAASGSDGQARHTAPVDGTRTSTPDRLGRVGAEYPAPDGQTHAHQWARPAARVSVPAAP